MSKLLRHCVKTSLAGMLLGILAACSSTSTSIRETDGQTQAPVAEAEVVEPTEILEEAPAEYAVDFTIEANLDEISERTQRSFDEALVAMRNEDWVQAEFALQQFIEDEPGFPGPYVNLALIYKQQGREGEARQALEQAIAIAPDFAPANNELGRMLRMQGDFEGARTAYERSLSADPGNAIAHLNLGILLDVYLRRSADALNHYNQYQATRTEPDQTVSRWIVDLERRVQAEARVAQD